MPNILEISQLVAGYGEAQVLHGVDLRVGVGEMVALVGANGAGKTTLLKTISGLVTPRSGSIRFMDESFDTLRPVQRVRAGLAHVPEGRQIFVDLTTKENLTIGAYVRLGKLSNAEVEARIDKVCEIFPVLREKMNLAAGGLSGGQQQMLAIGRGLMLEPRMLLLDEPSLGLSPVLVTEIFRVLKQLRELGVAILLSEQNARMSLAIADRGYVIETGKIVNEGTGAALLQSSDVMERYLGVGTSTVKLDEGEEHALTQQLRAVVGSTSR
jgi:branched-chain amino acid transport system ATP-binding protein